VPIDGHASGLAKKQDRDFARGDMGTDEFTDFLRTMCGRLVSASRDGSIHFICMDWRHVGELLDLVAGAGSRRGGDGVDSLHVGVSTISRMPSDWCAD